MADLSKIKLNGTEYDLKDAVARNKILTIYAVASNIDFTSESYSITLCQSLYGENPYPYKFWYGADPKLAFLKIHDLDGFDLYTGFYIAHMKEYTLELIEVNGNNNFKSKNIIEGNLGWDNPTIVYFQNDGEKHKSQYIGQVEITNNTTATFSGIPLEIIRTKLNLNENDLIYYRLVGEGEREVVEFKCAEYQAIYGHDLSFYNIHQNGITWITAHSTGDTFTGTVTEIEFPTAELDSNITSMLQDLGLNTTITLSPAEADETIVGSSVLTS